MSKKDRKSPHTVVIHLRFEPSRVAAACLAEGYAHVVPKVPSRGPTGQRPSPATWQHIRAVKEVHVYEH